MHTYEQMQINAHSHACMLVCIPLTVPSASTPPRTWRAYPTEESWAVLWPPSHLSTCPSIPMARTSRRTGGSGKGGALYRHVLHCCGCRYIQCLFVCLSVFVCVRLCLFVAYVCNICI